MVRRVAGKIALMIPGVVVGLLIGELIVRVVQPQRPVSQSEILRNFKCFKKSTYYWVSLQAGIRCMWSSSEEFSGTEIVTNSEGLRSPEITRPKPAGTTRILFVGDSFTFGWGVKEDEAYPRVVERILKQQFPGRTIETINAGVPAAGPGYYYLYLKNQGIAIDPDIVVLGFYVFDDVFSDTEWSEWKKIDRNGLPNQIASKTYEVDRRGTIRSTIAFGMDDAWYIPLVEQSQLALFAVRTGFSQYSPKKILTSTCVFLPSCRTLDGAIQKTQQLFGATAKMLRERHIPLLVVMIPAKLQFSQELFWPFGVMFGPPLLDLELPHRNFQTFFDTEQTAYINLLSEFREHEDQKLYFDADEHWTSAGHDIAARSISAWIADRLK